MKVVILAGGMGTRLQEETIIKPKPMVEIGGQPILWHIMKIFATQGFREFIIALGYKSEVVKNYFLNYHFLREDISINLKSGDVQVHNETKDDWLVHLVDTGDRTETGGRIKRLSQQIGGEAFLLTYGDGVANIDINELVSFHKSQHKMATVTAVRPPSRFGGLDFKGDLVSQFSEKPQIGEGWINGGFFVLEPEVLDYIPGDQYSWESEPINRLVAENQLAAYKHNGFWQCMDTLRDMRHLDAMWAEGNAPWKIWD
jgi:glucose-1-phosphate cytidylyltransferase